MNNKIYHILKEFVSAKEENVTLEYYRIASQMTQEQDVELQASYKRLRLAYESIDNLIYDYETETGIDIKLVNYLYRDKPGIYSCKSWIKIGRFVPQK